MSADAAYFRIEKMIKRGGECFLCALEDEVERKYIDAYLSELVMDAKSREKLIESGGFCNHHFYRMLEAAMKPESSDGHGIALIVQSVIERTVQNIRKQKVGRAASQQKTMCPACIHLANMMKVYIEKIVELFASRDKKFLSLLQDSKGLCIPHFTTLLKTLKETMLNKNQDAPNTLIEVEEKSLGRLISELSEYVRRQSYEFSDEDRRAIEDVLWRSIQKMVGRQGTTQH